MVTEQKDLRVIQVTNLVNSQGYSLLKKFMEYKLKQREEYISSFIQKPITHENLEKVNREIYLRNYLESELGNTLEKDLFNFVKEVENFSVSIPEHNSLDVSGRLKKWKLKTKAIIQALLRQ